MRRTRMRFLFAGFSIVSLVWFKRHPIIHFQPAQPGGALTLSEMTANVLVALVVAILAVVAVTSLGRAMGWWKDE